MKPVSSATSVEQKVYLKKSNERTYSHFHLQDGSESSKTQYQIINRHF